MATHVGGNMKVLYEDNHLLVVDKDPNIPIQKDSSNDEDLLTELKKYLKEKYNKKGNVYLGLVHRIDRPVSGVCVFAKTSKAASRLSETIRKNELKKKYVAVVEGKLDKKEDTLIDKLLKDTKTNMVKVSDKGKKSILSYKVLDSKNNMSLVDIDLVTGRPHQIRVQFSSRKHPIYGDHRYNKNVEEKSQIALHSYQLTFKHPVSKEELTFTSLPKRKPFNNYDLDSLLK